MMIEVDPLGHALFDFDYQSDFEKLKYSLNKAKNINTRIWAAKEILKVKTKLQQFIVVVVEHIFEL